MKDDLWEELGMTKITVVVICLFIFGLLVARYNNWFGFGGF